MNHHLLNLLGVGHASLDTVIAIAQRHSLHAKLTGAGGGGCAFALIPPCEMFLVSTGVDKGGSSPPPPMAGQKELFLLK